MFRKNDLTYGSTAGHCGNETWSHPQTANWSNPALEDYGDTYDATLRVDQNNGYDLQITTIHDRDKWKASNVIWRPSDGLYDITDQVNTPATSLLGHSVCAIGVGKIHYLGYAGETCGTLTAVYSDGFGVANMRICEGDSGGPVFGPTLNKAWGLMMGYPVGEGGVHCNAEASSRHAFFTWISKVESSSGFQVMLSP